jgi:hypothetical protein
LSYAFYNDSMIQSQKQKLLDRIEVARRAVRLASGDPLTSWDLEQERRKKEVAQLSDVASRISLDIGLVLIVEAVWEKGATVRIKSFESLNDPGQPVFYMRPAGNSFNLFQTLTPDDNETLLATIPQKDPLLANRLLVAVGDALSEEGHDSRE